MSQQTKSRFQNSDPGETGCVTSPMEVPDLVRRALRSSLSFGYVHTTRNETGRLLATLAASRTGTLGDLGTGSGAAAAWLRIGAPQRVRVVTVERDPALADTARETLSGNDIAVITGDHAELADNGPYSLLYLDRETAAQVDRDEIHDVMEPGGVVVIDDLPGDQEFCSLEAFGDTTRQSWLNDQRFESTDIAVAPDANVLIATRRD